MMLYTATSIVHGNVVTKEAVRVNTWLRTQSAPEYFHLYNAQTLLIPGAGPVQNMSFPEFFLLASQVIAYHILPPATEPMDFDASEPNRKMEPVTAIFGGFRLNGHIRMAAQSDLAHYLEIMRDQFISFYDNDISNPSSSGMGVIRAPMILARRNCLSLARRA
jgi:hypothetical protein